jgi:hypothetical protein
MIWICKKGSLKLQVFMILSGIAINHLLHALAVKKDRWQWWR